jgi:hypothetical protein
MAISELSSMVLSLSLQDLPMAIEQSRMNRSGWLVFIDDST